MKFSAHKNRLFPRLHPHNSLMFLTPAFTFDIRTRVHSPSEKVSANGKTNAPGEKNVLSYYLGGYETLLGQFVLEPVQAAGMNVALFNGPWVLKQ